MAHVEAPRRTKEGTYWTRVRYRTGGRGTPLESETLCGYESKDDCIEAATHWGNDFERRKYLGQVSHLEVALTITCGEVVESWMEHHVRIDLAENSQAYYESAVPLYFTPFFGEMPFLEVTPLVGQRWRKWLLERVVERLNAQRQAQGLPSLSEREAKQAGRATVTKMIALGRGIFSFGQQMGWRPDNPLEALKPPRPPKETQQEARKRKWAPQAVQVEAIRSVISQERAGTRDEWVIHRDRLFVSMMGFEACRQEDLYGACWWQLIDDDGNIRRRFLIASGKTRAAEREVKLWRQVREEIAAYYELRGRPDLDELIFPGIRGAVMTRHNWQRDVWRPALAGARKLAGFKGLRHFGPHRLRACAATMLGYALTPQHVALQFLGHEQWTTTAKFYLVAFEDSEGLEGVPVEKQIGLAREQLAPGNPASPSAADETEDALSEAS
jgi:integrase